MGTSNVLLTMHVFNDLAKKGFATSVLRFKKSYLASWYAKEKNRANQQKREANQWQEANRHVSWIKQPNSFCHLHVIVR